MDDVINTAGHRISTGRLEEVINDHTSIVESAVVGYNEPIRGECALAFCVLSNEAASALTHNEEGFNKLKKEINSKVRADVGAFASLFGIIFMEKLPKTRSGKILRGTMRNIANCKPYGNPATIDDFSTLDVVRVECEKW
jgi:propionyl-CoA synthetase